MKKNQEQLLSTSALIQEKVAQSVKTHLGEFLSKKDGADSSPPVKGVKKLIKESLVLIPKVFGWKTEKLSGSTKEAHERLYNGYIKEFNQAALKADVTAPEDVASFRLLKREEGYLLNAVKLHELYFSNIADPKSVVHVDSLPYMRFARDWGSFDRWQIDFRACCLASRSGWAMTVYDPFKERYLNVIVDGHDSGVPVGCVPVLVMDMWEHAYNKDYLDDKFSYVNNMLREVNWTVVEARMILAERSQLSSVYKCVPLVPGEPETVLATTSQGVRTSSGPVQPQQPMGPEEMVARSVTGQTMVTTVGGSPQQGLPVQDPGRWK